MTGIQTLVPTMLVHVNSGGLSLERFVDITSHEPNRLFGVARIGHMAVGYDADLNFGDLKCRESIRNGRIASRAGRTPDDGATVTGWTVGTIERGHRVV